MSRTSRQRRGAGIEATRRWRRRRAKGIRLVTIEVSEVRLDQLVADGLIPAAVLEDSVRLGMGLGRIIDEGKLFAGAVMDHAAGKTGAAQGFEGRDAITQKTGQRSGPHTECHQTKHASEQGRDRYGRWLKGTSGNPQGRVPAVEYEDDPWFAQLLEQLEKQVVAREAGRSPRQRAEPLQDREGALRSGPARA